MKELKIFKREDYSKIKILDKSINPYMGYVYIVEFDENVKIGYSKNPYSRLQSFIRNFEHYGKNSIGRVAVSKVHTNYVENEKFLHEHFSEYRVSGTELFNLSFEEVIGMFPDLNYLDETEEKERKANSFCDGMKNLLFEQMSK